MSPSYETVASILGPSGSASTGLDLQDGKDQSVTVSSKDNLAERAEKAALEEGWGSTVGSAAGSFLRQDGG